MTTLTVDSLSRLSTLLYEAVYDDALWPDACGAIRQAFDCQAATLLVRQGSDFTRIYGDCDRYYSDLYWNDLMHYDPLQAGPADDAHCTVYTDQTVLDKSSFRKSIMFNEWFAPQEIQGLLLFKAFDQQGVNTIFTLNRGTRQNDFNAHDVVAMRTLEPVLRHVIRLRQHVATLQSEARSSTFEQMHVGHIIVDKQRHIVHMNPTADRLLSMASMPLLIHHKRLTTSSTQTTNALDRLILLACSGPARAHAMGSELLLYTESGPSLALCVYPLMEAMGYGVNSQYGASIVIRAIGASPSPGIQVRLQALLSLSTKEAELAAALLNGYSLQYAAEQRKVSLTTVRSQLASLFRKTGTTRQGQLIALLAQLSLPF